MSGIQKIPIDPQISVLIGALMAYKMGIKFDDLQFIYRAGYVAGGKALIGDLVKKR